MKKSYILIPVLCLCCILPVFSEENSREEMRVLCGKGRDLSEIDLYSNILFCSEWQGFHGVQPLSEGDFFRITGYPEQGETADAYHRKSKVLRGYGLWGTIGGLAGIITGGVLTYVAMQGYDDFMIPALIVNIAGWGVGISGVIVWPIGLLRKPNWAPIESAQYAARRYNEQIKDNPSTR